MELNDNFWKWFAGSKVVDENGNPLVVYHGSGAKFDTFDTTCGYIGTWFTDNRKNSEKISKGIIWLNDESHVYSVYLKIQNPKIYNKPEEFEGSVDTHWQFYNDVNRYSSPKEYVNELKKNGFDGIIIENTYLDTKQGSTDYVVFEPNQIKSVDNNGNWSNSDNIYETLNKELEKFL